MFWAQTPKDDSAIPEGSIRVHVCKLETFELDNSHLDQSIKFHLLPALAVNKPQVATIIRRLGQCITANAGHLLSIENSKPTP